MEYTQLIEMLTKIDKKLDKILSRQTKIAKVLHLLPVTADEERNIQILQRKNLAEAAKVNSELNAMENKPDTNPEKILNMGIVLESEQEIYGDLLGDDFNFSSRAEGR